MKFPKWLSQAPERQGVFGSVTDKTLALRRFLNFYSADYACFVLTASDHGWKSIPFAALRNNSREARVSAVIPPGVFRPASIVERAEALGARSEIFSSDKKTSVKVEVPL